MIKSLVPHLGGILWNCVFGQNSTLRLVSYIRDYDAERTTDRTYAIVLKIIIAAQLPCGDDAAEFLAWARALLERTGRGERWDDNPQEDTCMQCFWNADYALSLLDQAIPKRWIIPALSRGYFCANDVAELATDDAWTGPEDLNASRVQPDPDQIRAQAERGVCDAVIAQLMLDDDNTVYWHFVVDFVDPPGYLNQFEKRHFGNLDARQYYQLLSCFHEIDEHLHLPRSVMYPLLNRWICDYNEFDTDLLSGLTNVFLEDYTRTNQRARDAIYVWSVCGMRLGLVRDVCHLIAKMLWDARFEWSQTKTEK